MRARPARALGPQRFLGYAVWTEEEAAAAATYIQAAFRGQRARKLLALALQCLGARVASGADFDVLQAYLHRLLRLHGEVTLGVFVFPLFFPLFFLVFFYFFYQGIIL